MTHYQLNAEEQELLDAVEAGQYTSAPNLEEQKAFFQEVARNTTKKTKNINLRITEFDLSALKNKSIEEGIPYETLAASVLHKYVTGRLVSS